jgi:hypothetical protein
MIMSGTAVEMWINWWIELAAQERDYYRAEAMSVELNALWAAAHK